MLTRFIGSKRYWDDLDNADRELLLRGVELHVRICKEKFDRLFNMTLIEKMRYKG